MDKEATHQEPLFPSEEDGEDSGTEERQVTSDDRKVESQIAPSRAGTNVNVSWQSVVGVNYFLERSTNLWASPPFTLLAPNLPGQPGTTSFTDTNAAGARPFFYRVGVGE